MRARLSSACRTFDDRGVKHLVRIGGADAEVVVTTSGTATIDGFDAVVESILGNRRYLPGLRVLFDHSKLDWRSFEQEDLVRRLHLALQNADLLGPRRIAVVSSDERMLLESAGTVGGPPWRAFESSEEARAWLGTAPAPGHGGLSAVAGPAPGC